MLQSTDSAGKPPEETGAAQEDGPQAAMAAWNPLDAFCWVLFTYMFDHVCHFCDMVCLWTLWIIVESIQLGPMFHLGLFEHHVARLEKFASRNTLNLPLIPGISRTLKSSNSERSDGKRSAWTPPLDVCFLYLRPRLIKRYQNQPLQYLIKPYEKTSHRLKVMEIRLAAAQLSHNLGVSGPFGPLACLAALPFEEKLGLICDQGNAPAHCRHHLHATSEDPCKFHAHFLETKV